MDIDYLLLLDCNDELKNTKDLIQVCSENKETVNTAFLLKQEWWSGQRDTYYNVRMLKPRDGWRYKGRVHEWLKNPKYEEMKEPVLRVENVSIYQDRTQDDDKSGRRFHRDKELLLQDHRDDPTDPRTVFYLAQTCSCLGHFEECLYYYKLRSTMVGFWEEVFHSLVRCGEMHENHLKNPWHCCIEFYMKALEHSKRAEVAVKIAEHYMGTKDWFLAYYFSKMACDMEFPQHCILFIDKLCYDYRRWRCLGVSAFYMTQLSSPSLAMHQFRDGKAATQTAIATGVNPGEDEKILKFYTDKEKELSTPKVPITKQQFIADFIKSNSSLGRKQCMGLAKKRWASRKA
jgi:hypothetical protein